MDWSRHGDAVVPMGYLTLRGVGRAGLIVVKRGEEICFEIAEQSDYSPVPIEKLDKGLAKLLDPLADDVLE
jgi:hypothetical protein